MKERPILYSGSMVCAALDGRKTATRRFTKLHAHYGLNAFLGMEGDIARFSAMDDTRNFTTVLRCPYGRPGDRLWVREAWSDVNLMGAPGLAYRADGDVRDLMEDAGFLDEGGAFNYDDRRCKPYHFACWSEDLLRGTEGRWRPSIHMPRWVSRLLLEITAVSVERLQAGDGETAFESRYLAEGINRIHHGDGEYYYSAFRNEPHPKNWCDPFDAWRELWVSINGIDSWNANPWVWVVEFKRVEQTA